MGNVFIIICCALLVASLYIYSMYLKSKRLKSCVKLFAKYPLYTRWLICRYNHNNIAIIDRSIIENYKEIPDELTISHGIPSYQISYLSNIKLENKKAVEIENRLKVILELYNLYPRALSVIFSYSSLSMNRFFLKKTYPIEKFFSINDTDIIHQKLDTKELQAIETSIDNIFSLDSVMFNIRPIKSDAKSIIDILENNGQEYLYHFTHKENLKQIKELGGLYSWIKLDKMNKPCQHPGSTSLSRSLDVKYGLEDYVHLSFCFEHPMSFRNEKDIVILLIHPIVCLLPDTLFCNMNATDSEHRLGPNLEDLERVNFYAVTSHLPKGSKLFKAKQAEVLVKGFIPSRYIVNLYFAD